MNTQLATYYLLAMMVGILGGIHVPINGAMGSRIGSTLVATFIFYGIAFLLVTLLCVLLADRSAFVAATQVPRWYFLAGVISLVVVSTSTYLIPRMGAVNLFVIVLSLQLLSRMVISHFGWLESPMNAITGAKLLGGLFLLIGAVLVVRY